ncbi:MAG: VWA domain-containing protein [Treponema sp.]|jgi:Ca-activated chloride channel family protein|nr:VWA domain-containing protein [Treponema sp.]
MIGFDRPLLTILLLALFFLVLFLGSRLRPLAAMTVPLGSPGGVPFKSPLSLEYLLKVLRFLEYGGVMLLIAAAGGPVIKTRETLWLGRGADILFVLDISPSMAALDMEGSNRFDAARNLIRDFALRRPSDAIGLVAVGSDAGVLVPSTTDRQALFSRLEALRIGELGDGTALGTGLALALLHLNPSTAPRRAAVLITDGENNAGAVQPETVAAMYPAGGSSGGVSLWVVGVGSGGEVPIDYVDPVTGTRRTGIFNSRFNTESLMRITGEAGGHYLSAASASGFAAAFARLDREEITVGRSDAVSRRRSCRIPFILAALFLAAATRFIRVVFLGADA